MLGLALDAAKTLLSPIIVGPPATALVVAWTTGSVPALVRPRRAASTDGAADVRAAGPRTATTSTCCRRDVRIAPDRSA